MPTKPDPPLHEAMRAQLIRDHLGGASDDVPKCFGTLPQGNESAWAKGCKECYLYVHGDQCSDATQVVRDAEEEREIARAFVAPVQKPCARCGGRGQDPYRAGAPCRSCYGTGHAPGVCPKCKATSGDDWNQCKGDCPMPESPHYKRFELRSDERGPLIYDRAADAVLGYKDILRKLNDRTE